MIAALIASALAAGCAGHRVRVYEAPQSAPAITTAELRLRVFALLPVECPRLLGNRQRLTGTVQLALAIDSTGRVARARLEHGSGRGVMDDAIGALASRLRLAPAAPPAATTVADASSPPLVTRTLLVQWECARTSSMVRVVLVS